MTIEEQHRADMALINSELCRLAAVHDWCDQFDDMIADLNTMLNVKLAGRKRPHLVTFDVVMTLVTWVDANDADQSLMIAKRNTTVPLPDIPAVETYDQFEGHRLAQVVLNNYR
jgi:hypothetical protein